MRKEDIEKLEDLYEVQNNQLFDRRFDSSIGADIPNAVKMAEDIYNDLDPISFGISWWNSLPTQERILISDYLLQCAGGISDNLVEAKLHYLEWINAKSKNNKKIADVISRKSNGKPEFNLQPPQKALDELENKIEELHICGFFRAIGSSLDCLAALIIGVLALPVQLKVCDINRAIKALENIKSDGLKGTQLQIDFLKFFNDVKNDLGKDDWLEWATQYRNMYVHRGRRLLLRNIHIKDTILFDSEGNPIPRACFTHHLAKNPDRSEIEAMLKNSNRNIDEDAEITISGIFGSCRNLCEIICEELLRIWKERRDNPNLLEQPLIQWKKKFMDYNFEGYNPDFNPPTMDTIVVNPIVAYRMKSASVFDSQRELWENSQWIE